MSSVSEVCYECLPADRGTEKQADKSLTRFWVEIQSLASFSRKNWRSENKTKPKNKP